MKLVSNDGLQEEAIGLIPAKILKDAAAPAREIFRSALERLPAVYEPLVTDMADHFLEPDLDMRTLWLRHGLNEKYHSKILTQVLGDSLWTFARKRRIETAARLLADERIATLPLHTLALATGFNSTNALNAAFKAWSRGVPPSDYRRLQLAKVPVSAPAGREELKVSRPSATVRETLRGVYRLTLRNAFDDVAFDTALGKLQHADALVKQHNLAEFAGDLAAHRGLLHHCRGALRTMYLDIDGAYADLTTANCCYAASPPLPKLIQRSRRRLLFSDDTRFLFLKELCVPCRSRLLGPDGQTMREYLTRALDLVPRDLRWLRGCCDPCYRVVWRAIEKARLGLIDDAWKAFWLAAHAEPVDNVRPSLARYVRALFESESLTYQRQRPRLELCRLAVETARELGDCLWEAYARCFEANALRATGSFGEARATLEAAAGACRENPWAAAFLAEIEGKLAAQEGNRQAALDTLETARSLYTSLDPHLVGFVIIAEGEVYYFERSYEAASRSFENALSALDHRREPVLAFGLVPLNLAAALSAQGRPEDARFALRRCEFDRAAYPGLAATELFVCGCVALDEQRLEEALEFFRRAATLLESLDRLRDKALASCYSVEAYAGLGNRQNAIQSAAEALGLFRALGCQHDTIEAFSTLRQQLEAGVIDAAAVALTVRRVARNQAGWLPEPRGLGERGR